jgi:beta-glucanase (GH16 family)
VGVTRDPDQKSTAQWFLPSNIEVSNGTLKLGAKRDTFLNRCFDLWMNAEIGMRHFCKDFYYSTSEVATKENFGHGKFEISCKLPKGKGLGTAFWIWQQQQQSEIDIFEFQNENNIVGKYSAKKLSKIHCMNLHNDYYNNGVNEDCPTHYSGPEFSEQFHTFTVIWTPHLVEWYLDGELKKTSTLFYSMLGQPVNCGDLRKGTEYIINKAFPIFPMHALLTLVTESGDDAPDETTNIPAVFEIDYFRYYRLE